MALLLLLAACRGDDSGAGAGSGAPATTGGAAGTPPATAGPGGDPARVKAKLVKVADVASPTAMAVRPGDDGIYVAEKAGRVRYVPRGQTASPAAAGPTSVLDVSSLVSTGGEQGLLGLTFDPGGTRLYINYTDRAGDTQVVEYQFRDGKADPATARTLLSVDQPFANHNGGQVAFGPDGKLYVGLGDGGSGGDPGNRAQNLGALLGKILRIDPAPGPNNKPYSIPGDNPFLERSGAQPEIWAYGLRNPWRFSWDRGNGDFWMADVGENAWEEVNYVPASTPGGVNYGWPQLEGTHRFRGANPEGAVLPVHEYGHDLGCSVTGGFVYRGTKAPTLQGIYVYGDACTGRIWGLIQSGGKLAANAELKVAGASGLQISSFGEDAAGELYLLNLGGGLYRFEA